MTSRNGIQLFRWGKVPATCGNRSHFARWAEDEGSKPYINLVRFAIHILSSENINGTFYCEVKGSKHSPNLNS